MTSIKSRPSLDVTPRPSAPKSETQKRSALDRPSVNDGFDSGAFKRRTSGDDGFTPVPKAKPDSIKPPPEEPGIVGKAIAELKGESAAPLDGPKEKSVHRPKETDPSRAADRVEKARETADAASKDYDAAKAELDSDLAAAPNMTPEERQKYIEAYWAKKPGVREKYEAAMRELSAEIRACTDVIEASGSQSQLLELYAGYDTLSHSDGPGHGKEVLDFFGRVASNPDLEDRLVESLPEPVRSGMLVKMDETAARALTHAQTEAIAAHAKGDPSLLASLGDTVGQLAKARSLFNKVKGAFEEFAKVFSDPTKITAQAVTDFARKWGNESALGKALAVYGVAMSVATVIDGEGSYARQLVELMKAGAGTAEILIGALSTLGKSMQQVGKAMQNAAGEALSLASRVLKIVDAVVKFADEFVDLLEKGGRGQAIQTMGATFALVGASVALLAPPVSTAIGAAFIALGAVVNEVGNWVSDGDQKKVDEARRRELMTQAGVPQDIQDWMIANPEAATGLAVGLMPDHVNEMRELIQKHPDVARRLGEKMEGYHPDIARRLVAELLAGMKEHGSTRSLIDVLIRVTDNLPDGNHDLRRLLDDDRQWLRRQIGA